jgi:hypothetical protein
LTPNPTLVALEDPEDCTDRSRYGLLQTKPKTIQFRGDCWERLPRIDPRSPMTTGVERAEGVMDLLKR